MTRFFTARFLLLILTVWAFGTMAARAQALKRVEFPAGRTTVTLKGSLDKGFADHFVRGRAGERLEVDLKASDVYGRLNIYRTNYDEPLGDAGEMIEGSKESTGWRGVLGGDGDYHIYVFNSNGTPMTYTLEITLLPAGPRPEDYDGYYVPSRSLKAFPGFDGVVVTTITYSANGKITPVKPRAGVSINDKTIYAPKTTLNDNVLSFQTLTVRGVSYSFTGAFHSPGSTEPKMTSLKGRLTKTTNGKKTEANVELTYQEGVD